MYANPTEVIRTTFGETSYTTTEGTQDAGYVISFVEGDTVYVAADYVKLFTNYSYDCYDRHVQVYTEWGTRQVAQLKKDTAVRLRGGVKSPILTQAAKGDTLEILEQMETWSKVKTADSVIGYVENKRLGDITEETETPVTDYQEPEYTALTSDSKICLGWHSIGGVGGNDTLYSMVSGTKGMNVIAPTWFMLTDNQGNYESLADKNYVDRAHSMGLQVWAVLDNFNKGENVQSEILFASMAARKKLIASLMQDAKTYGFDGINLDVEGIKASAGPHYVQFIRELSIDCRKEGLVLSIDSYVPASYSAFYNWAEQGRVADYVVMMGYDEHYAGGEAGSVASIGYERQGIEDLLKQVPKEKLISAIPFYTRIWKEDASGTTSQSLGIADAKAWVEDNQVELYWQDDLGQYYGETQKDGVNYEIWMEEERSLALKMQLIRDNGLAGVACWRLGLEPADIWDTVKLP